MLNRIGPQQRRVIQLSLIALFAEAAAAVVNALALPVFVDEELKATVYLGLIGSSFLLVEALMKGPTGVLSDRVGRRILLILAPLGSAFAAVALTWVHPPVHLGKLCYLVGVRCLDGMAAAAFWPSMYAAVADQVPEERRASAMSTLTVSYLLGLGAGVPLGGWATDQYSVRVCFYLVGGLFVFTSVAAFFLVPRTADHAPIHTGEVEEVSLAAFRESLGRAPHVLAIAFAVFLGIGLLYQTAPLIARHEFALSAQRYGKLFVIPTVFIGLITVPLGRLSDRWGPSRSVHLGMGLSAGALWGLALLPKSAVLLVVGASVLGIGFVIGIPAWLAVVSKLANPHHRGAMLGAVSMAQGLGAFVGVLLGPILFAAYGVATRLDRAWPGRLTPNLLPVIGAAAMVTLSWLATLLVVREGKLVGPGPTGHE